MAPSHVPNGHLQHVGQDIYTNPSYQNLYPSDQFAAQPWNNAQPWHPNTTYSQPPVPPQPQSYTPMNQPYPNQGQAVRTASPYQYGQFDNRSTLVNYSHNANIDPSLSVDSNLMRQQQHSPYAVGAQNRPPQTQSSTVTPQVLQHNLAVQAPRTVSSPYQVSLCP